MLSISKNNSRISMLKTICLLVSSLPWKFGAYQRQAYTLSKALTEYNIMWMPFAMSEPVKERVYENIDSLYEQFDTIARPPEDFDHSHLTFVGLDSTDKVTSVSRLNRLANEYGIDAYIMIGDIVKLIRDADFAVPSVVWFPHHYNHLAPYERFTLNAFGGIVSLSPSSSRMIADTLERPVTFIPHVVDVNTTAEPKHDTYTVLMQGGNYDKLDRKGWNIGLQAFRRFHEKYPDTHLYMHAISSREIAQHSRNRKAPLGLKPEGLALEKLVDMYGLEPDSYTLDDTVHTFEKALSFKKRAHVCLHPSRVEGFGMNVLECQMVHTPVVTTNFTAMGDFTQYGISVPYEQMDLFNDKELVAVPSVTGTAAALERIYTSAESLESFDPSPYTVERVTNAFRSFLANVSVPKEPIYSMATRENYTMSNTLWTILSDRPVRDRMMRVKLKTLPQNVLVAIIGESNPVDDEGYIHSNIPVAVRTHYLHRPFVIEKLLSVHALEPKNVVSLPSVFVR